MEKGKHIVDPHTPEGAAALTEALRKLALSGDHTPTPTEDLRIYKGPLFKEFRKNSKPGE